MGQKDVATVSSDNPPAATASLLKAAHLLKDVGKAAREHAGHPVVRGIIAGLLAQATSHDQEDDEDLPVAPDSDVRAIIAECVLSVGRFVQFIRVAEPGAEGRYHLSPEIRVAAERLWRRCVTLVNMASSSARSDVNNRRYRVPSDIRAALRGIAAARPAPDFDEAIMRQIERLAGYVYENADPVPFPIPEHTVAPDGCIVFPAPKGIFAYPAPVADADSDRETSEASTGPELTPLPEAPPPIAVASSPADEDRHRAPDPPKARLPVRVTRAWQSLEWVRQKQRDLDTSGRAAFCRAQYDYIKEHGAPSYEGVEVPSYETWGRYIREWQRYYQGPTQSPRAGRPTGPSIVRGDQI